MHITYIYRYVLRHVKYLPLDKHGSLAEKYPKYQAIYGEIITKVTYHN